MRVVAGVLRARAAAEQGGASGGPRHAVFTGRGASSGAGRVLALGDAALAIRPKGFLTVTYRRREQAAAPVAQAQQDPIDLLRGLAELRDAGIVSAGEFEAKKAEILARM